MNENVTEKDVESTLAGLAVGALDTLGWELLLGAGLGRDDTVGPGVTVGGRLGNDEGSVLGPAVLLEGVSDGPCVFVEGEPVEVGRGEAVRRDGAGLVVLEPDEGTNDGA